MIARLTLTEEQVDIIRDITLTAKEVGKLIGICDSSVNNKRHDLNIQYKPYKPYKKHKETVKEWYSENDIETCGVEIKKIPEGASCFDES